MPKYRFDQIAINSTEKKKPVEADKDTYIGLEHLDSGNLEVSRWGSEVAPIGDKLVMRKGDVLFGRRRAYQKKVAIAPFDGIFSAHGMVLRPIESVITKEFFPFFISSDYFLDAAIQISVGSLSPTINWRDLCKLEFNIPSIEQQNAISGMLQEMNHLKNAYGELLKGMDVLVQSQFVEVFGESKAYGSPTTVADVCINTMIGPFGSALHINETTEEGEIFVLGTDNAVDNVFNVYKKRYIDLKKYESLKKYTVKPKDIIVSMMGTIGRTAIIPDDFGTAIISSHLCCLTPDPEKVRTEFLNAILQLHDGVLKQINDQKKGTIMSGLNLKIINGLSFCLPRLDEQDRFISFLHQTDKSKYVDPLDCLWHKEGGDLCA